MIFTTVDSIDEIKNSCQKFLFDDSPFINYDFFYFLEKTFCTDKNSGWIPKHITLEENKKIIGIIPNFKKLNSNGEYIFDHSWENAHYQLGLNYFPKYLSATPFTPVSRENFFYSKEKQKKINYYKELKLFLENQEISSFHINFIYKKTSEELKKNNFLQRIGIQYHWENKNYNDFDDFLSKLKSRKRKNIIKEREFLKKKKIYFSIKNGKEICKDDITLFFKCYKNTINKKWSNEYLNINFFQKLLSSSELKTKLLLISAYDKNGFMGCSLHFIGKTTLYGRYWGSIRNEPYLHFELCYYQAIEYAIKKKILRVEAGAQGEHKISRGYLPSITYSNHWIKNNLIKDSVKKFLDYEKKKILMAKEILGKYNPFND